jgi:hypothetical protein
MMKYNTPQNKIDQLIQDQEQKKEMKKNKLIIKKLNKLMNLNKLQMTEKDKNFQKNNKKKKVYQLIHIH